MTSIKPRPFLVVLATAVASQDGVVAAGDSVRNCRRRPGAEQRLLPVIGHPIPGKCEPRFTLSTNSLSAPVEPGTRTSLGRVTVARRKRSVPAPSLEISLVTSASSAGPAARLSLPNPSLGRPKQAFFAYPQRRPPPSCHPGCLPAEFPPHEEKNRRPGLACSLTSAWEGGKERLSQVSQGGAGRGGEKETISFPG